MAEQAFNVDEKLQDSVLDNHRHHQQHNALLYKDKARHQCLHSMRIPITNYLTGALA